jgi:small GTP-binding protein
MADKNKTTDIQSNVFKIVLLGDKGSGKSMLVLKYINPVHDISPLTIGVDFKQKDVNYEGKSCRLQIWDTAGQERFRAITKSYFRGASGLMVVFNVADYNSFMNVRSCIQEIELHSPKVPFIIVGNVCSDQEQFISSQQGIALAAEFNTTYVEVNSKTENVGGAFDALLKKIIK